MEMRRSLTDLGNRRNGHLFFALVDVISILCWKRCYMKNENTGNQSEVRSRDLCEPIREQSWASVMRGAKHGARDIASKTAGYMLTETGAV